MKRLFISVLCFFVFFVYKINAQDYLLVKPKQNVNIETFFNGNQSFIKRINRIDALKTKRADKAIYRLKTNKFYTLEENIAFLKSSGLFEYIEIDAIGKAAGVQMIPNDPQYASKQWSLNNTGTFTLSTATVDADINMPEAWNIATGSSSIVVGVIDSGTKLDHPEFSGRLWVNTGEIPSNGIDDDNNGYVDDINGWDFANNDNNPSDDQGHGTNVASIIGMKGNNGIGLSGIDWNCKILTCKGLDANGNGFYSYWINSIYYCIDNGVDVINMSLQGASYSQAMQDAVTAAYNAGIVVVACSGNYNTSTKYYPGGLDNLICVGSTNPNDSRTSPFFWSSTSGSNYGSHLDLVAPGHYIYGLSHTSNTSYTYWGGTSQATPHVAAIASIMLGMKPTLTPSEVESILKSTAKDRVGPLNEDAVGFDIYFGYGRLDAYQALLYVQNSLTQNPTITFNNVNKTYGDASFAMTATSNSSGALTYSIQSGTAASITSNGQVTILGAGVVTVKVDQAAASGYNAGSQTATLTIAKKDLTITADNKSRAYNTANPTLTMTYIGFVYSDNAGSITSPSIATTAITSSNAGTYAITLSGGSAANYNLLLNNGTLTVNKIDPTLTYTGLTSGTVSTSLALSATSNSSGVISYTVTNGTGAATVNGTNLDLTSAGTISLNITVAATTNYNAKTINQVITINDVVQQTAMPVFSETSDRVCLGAASIVYSVENKPNTVYTWKIDKGATITTGQGTNAIFVTFENQTQQVVVSCEATENGKTVSNSLKQFVDVVDCNVSSIEASSELLAQAIYPNPSTSIFSIEIDTPVEMTVMNMFGQVVEERKINSTVEIGLSYTAGTYIVKIQKDNQVQFFKIIKE